MGHGRSGALLGAGTDRLADWGAFMNKDKEQAQMFIDEAARLEAAKENNFCPRCGTKLVGIELHTCEPPQQ
jgi:hypothetical protein